jgi:mitochondrial import receptor subunit TOM40
MNPGPYEQAAGDGKRLVSLDTFDGFRCDINKQVSPYMAVVHSFWLGTNMLQDGRKSTYTFLTQVADEQGLLMARIDPGRGSVDGRIHRGLLGGLAMGKLQVNVSTEGQGDQMLAEMDFGGHTWTGNLKYGSMGGGLVYGCNYFQAITPSLSMGGEGMYISANQNLLSNYTLKFTMPAKTGDEDSPVQAAAKAQPMAMGENTGSSTMCLNYNSGQSALSMNYKRVVTPNRVTLGAQLECSPFTLASEVLVGAEFRLQRSKFAVCVDGNGRMQSTLEAKLGMAPGSPSLNFTADVDHIKEEMRFGYGLTIDG